MHGIKRIFYDGELNGVIELDSDTSRKLKTVLRAETGDKVEILSPQSLGIGEICLVGKRDVQVRIDSVRDIVKPSYNLTVYQCITKREYMDWMVEKYTELGVTEIVPVISNRSLKDIKDNTLSRYKSIAVDASLQSERETVPVISNPVNIMKIAPKHDTKLLFHERIGEKCMPNNIANNVAMIIGAEGGFTENETEYLQSVGFNAYTPIDSILKAETAAVLFAGLVRLNIK